jgi:hypothetical protein
VGNIKEDHEDEVADWLTEEEVSNYHTFTIPYGPKFHAKRIEKLCYTRDLRKSPFPRLQEPAQTDMSFSAQCRVEPTRRQRGLPASSSSLCKIAQAVMPVLCCSLLMPLSLAGSKMWHTTAAATVPFPRPRMRSKSRKRNRKFSSRAVFHS